MTTAASSLQSPAEVIESELRDRGSPVRATKERAYLKSVLVHYGVGVAETRAIVRTALRGAELDPVVECWATDEDFWIRRSALLAHLRPLREGRGDFERFARFADGMLEEKEFFIRKAIGWVLRDTARKRPEMVFDWVLPRAHRASGVTMREVIKYLSPKQRDALRAQR